MTVFVNIILAANLSVGQSTTVLEIKIASSDVIACVRNLPNKMYVSTAPKLPFSH